MQITPEDIELLRKALSTSSASESATLIFMGITALAGIIFVVWWLLNIKLEPMTKFTEKLDALQATVNKLDAKMWSESELERMIQVEAQKAVTKHETDCPCRKAVRIKLDNN